MNTIRRVCAIVGDVDLFDFENVAVLKDIIGEKLTCDTDVLFQTRGIVPEIVFPYDYCVGISSRDVPRHMKHLKNSMMKSVIDKFSNIRGITDIFIITTNEFHIPSLKQTDDSSLFKWIVLPEKSIALESNCSGRSILLYDMFDTYAEKIARNQIIGMESEEIQDISVQLYNEREQIKALETMKEAQRVVCDKEKFIVIFGVPILRSLLKDTNGTRLSRTSAQGWCKYASRGNKCPYGSECWMAHPIDGVGYDEILAASKEQL